MEKCYSLAYSGQFPAVARCLCDVRLAFLSRVAGVTTAAPALWRNHARCVLYSYRSVTASTTNRGRLIFGALAGLLVWLIRSFGGYPDGVAFAVLLANITVPLIDYYTRPRVYGHR